MGKWSTYQRRAASTATAAVAPPPTVPVLAVACTLNVVWLSWTWEGVDPAEWRLDKSHNGVDWAQYDWISEDLREYELAADICASGEFDTYYRLVGVDGDREDLIDPSNTVWILCAEW